MNFQGSLLQKIIFALLALLIGGGGWLLTQSGFGQVKQIQQIERLSVSDVVSSLAGETKLNVSVADHTDTIKSEYFKKNSVYYYYRYEEEETDSDGNTYWDTKYTRSNGINFFAEDHTGKIKINIQSRANEALDYSLRVSEQQTNSTTRHTEWRIEPGDLLFIIGYLDNSEIGFIEKGHYIPLISKYSESEEKSDLGIEVVLMISGGISLIALASLCLTIALGIHRILAFLFILSFSVIIPLSQLGFSMLYDDIVSAKEKLSERESAVKNKIAALTKLSSLEDASWSEIVHSINQTDINAAQSTSIVADYVYLQERYRAQLDVFPNNLIAWTYGVEADSIISTLPEAIQQQSQDKLNAFKRTETSGIAPYAVGGGGLLVCVLLTWLGFRLIRLKRHIENLPTSKTSGLVFGLSELKGRAKAIGDQSPLIGPVTSAKCFWYRYIIEEKRHDGKETKWVTISDEKKSAPFHCKDAYGETKVIPKHAEIISKHSKTERRGNRRYTEKTLKLNDKVYLIGHAKIDRETGDTLVIRGDKKERPYLITNLSEEAVMYRKANRGMLSLTVAFSALMFCALFYLGINGSFSPSDYLIAAMVAPVYMSLVVLILHYNDLIFLKQRAARNLSNIDVSMQKRADLVPNLVKIVKKYLGHEKELLASVSSLRSKLKEGSSDLAEIGKTIEQEQRILGSIIALSEDYPDLKAHKLNVKLMNKLVDLENEIALMREGYNDAVEYYNTRIGSVPDVFIARAFGFKAIELLRFEAKKFKPVEVSFDSKSDFREG